MKWENIRTPSRGKERGRQKQNVTQDNNRKPGGKIEKSMYMSKRTVGKCTMDVYNIVVKNKECAES